MKAIEVRDQVRLSLRRCFQLCLHGIRHRLFRSAVTVVIVALAVAFLMMMLSTSTIDRQVARDVQQRTAGRRLLAEWGDKLGAPMTGAALTAKLASAQPHSPAWREIQRWGGLDDDQMGRLAGLSRRQLQYQLYLDELKPNERSALVGSRQDDAIWAALAEGERLDEFVGKANPFKPLPTGRQELELFVQEFVQTLGLRKQVLHGHAQAVAALDKELNQKPVLALLASGDEAALGMLRRHGFEAEPATLSALKSEAASALEAQELAELLVDERFRSRLAGEVGVKAAQVLPRHVHEYGSKLGGAEWIIRQVRELRRADLERQAPRPLSELSLSADQIVRVSRRCSEQAELTQIEARLGGAGGAAGFSDRTLWLIVISFLVCVVGVANAMLMSVTERFREIATMKCLGALDSFIMIIFVLESALQGLAGGIIGIVLGLALGLLRSLWSFGALALSNLPGLLLVAAAGACVAAGVVLAALAAVYPAWVAARLAPMEAMRIE